MVFLSEMYLKSLMEGVDRCINPQSVFLFRVDKNYLHNTSHVYVNEDEETEGFVYWVFWEQSEK